MTRSERSSRLYLMVAVTVEDSMLGFIANLLKISGSTAEKEA